MPKWSNAVKYCPKFPKMSSKANWTKVLTKKWRSEKGLVSKRRTWWSQSSQTTRNLKINWLSQKENSVMGRGQRRRSDRIITMWLSIGLRVKMVALLLWRRKENTTNYRRSKSKNYPKKLFLLKREVLMARRKAVIMTVRNCTRQVLPENWFKIQAWNLETTLKLQKETELRTDRSIRRTILGSLPNRSSVTKQA